ncbi:MAG TPA: diguanylate cyclase [Desulfotomaculum sp.]|nr:diguanylate cyclase [Desulfotomaculum sp.]
MKLLLATGMPDLNTELTEALAGGMEVEECYNRLAVYDVAGEKDADTVLISQNLPGNMDLVEIVRLLRSAGKRVIVMPGSPDMRDTREVIKQVLPLGVYDFVYDPVSVEGIIYRLKNPGKLGDVPAELVREAMEAETVSKGVPDVPETMDGGKGKGIIGQASGKGLLGKLASRFRGRDRRVKRPVNVRERPSPEEWQEPSHGEPDSPPDPERLRKETTRQTDVVVRYGGEEFIIIFPGLDDARGIANRLCRGWAGQRIKLPDGQVISSTFSGGLAVMGRDARDVGGLIRAADGALYRAKGAGRNRVSAACSGTAPQKTKITRVPKIITVWSPLSIPIGKTFIAANLAAVLTWKGYSVLLIVPGPEIKWFNMQPDSLEKLLADPHRAWKMSGRCEEVPGVTLVAGIPKSAKSLKMLPVDIIVIDGVSAISSDLLLAVTIPGGTLNGGVPPDAQKIITVVNRAAQCYQSTDNHIVIPERADDAARGMKRGIPPVIYSKELAEAFIKLETAAGL